MATLVTVKGGLLPVVTTIPVTLVCFTAEFSHVVVVTVVAIYGVVIFESEKVFFRKFRKTL